MKSTPIPLEMTCAMQRAMVEACTVPLSPADTRRIYAAMVAEGLRHNYSAATPCAVLTSPRAISESDARRLAEIDRWK